VKVKSDVRILENVNMEDVRNSPEKYTVTGEINAFYSEILINKVCNEKPEI
jgi:hypothetical protein